MELFVAFRGRKPTRRCPARAPRAELMAARVATWLAIAVGGTAGALAALGSSGSMPAAAPAPSAGLPLRPLGAIAAIAAQSPSAIPTMAAVTAAPSATSAAPSDSASAAAHAGRQRARKAGCTAARGGSAAAAHDRARATAPRDELRSTQGRVLHRCRAQLRERQRGPDRSGKGLEIPAHRANRLDQPVRPQLGHRLRHAGHHVSRWQRRARRAIATPMRCSLAHATCAASTTRPSVTNCRIRKLASAQKRNGKSARRSAGYCSSALSAVELLPIREVPCVRPGAQNPSADQHEGNARPSLCHQVEADPR